MKRFFLQDELTPFRGGESEALKRLRESIRDKVYVMYCKNPYLTLLILLKRKVEVMSNEIFW